MDQINIQVSVILWVVLLFCVIGAISYFLLKHEDTKEDFMMNNMLMDMLYSESEMLERSGSDRRKCAIYFTSNVDLCDQGWYNYTEPQLLKEISTLEAKPVASRTRYERNQLAKLKKVYEDKKTGIPGGECKLEFPGMWERRRNDFQEAMPKKIVSSNPDFAINWAVCYAEGTNPSSAVHKAKLFANNQKYVVAKNEAERPFKDNRDYGVVRFKTLRIDDYRDGIAPYQLDRYGYPRFMNEFVCSTPPPKTDLPSDFMRLTVTPERELKKMRFVTYNSSKYEFRPYTSPNSLKGMFFATKAVGKKVYLLMKNIDATIYKLGFDLCGRVNRKLEVKPHTFNLKDDLGFKHVVLYDGTNGSDELVGTYHTLLARKAGLRLQRENLIKELSAPIPVVTTTVEYKSGFPYKMMKMTKVTYVNNKTEMDTAMREMKPMSEGVWKGPIYGHISQNCKSTNYQTTWFGLQMNAWLKLGPNDPPGVYYFALSTDDASDLMINLTPNNGSTYTPVAEWYGSHGVIKSKPITKNPIEDSYLPSKILTGVNLQKDVAYPIQIRLVQGICDAGLRVYWKKPNTDWDILSTDVIYYDPVTVKKGEAELKAYYEKQQTLEDVKQRIVKLRNRAIDLQASTMQEINRIWVSLYGRMLQRIPVDLISGKDEIYVHIGPFPNNITQDRTGITSPVVLIDRVYDVCKGVRYLDSPVVNYDTNVSYTISLWINVNKLPSDIFNIFKHVEPNANDAATPGLTIDRSGNLCFDQSTDKLKLNRQTIDKSKWYTPGQWFHFAASVNGSASSVRTLEGETVQGQTMEIYINGKLQSTVKGTFIWMRKYQKLMYINYTNNTQNCGIKIAQMKWLNRASGPKMIGQLHQDKPIPTSLKEVLDQKIEGINYMLMGGRTVRVFVHEYNNKYYATILRYALPRGTSAKGNFISIGSDLPIPSSPMTASRLYVENLDERDTPAWGHLKKDYVQTLGITEGMIIIQYNNNTRKELALSSRDIEWVKGGIMDWIGSDIQELARRNNAGMIHISVR